MGTAHQVANALVAAIFLIALVVTTQIFTEYRSAQAPVITFAERSLLPL